MEHERQKGGGRMLPACDAEGGCKRETGGHSPRQPGDESRHHRRRRFGSDRPERRKHRPGTGGEERPGQAQWFIPHRYLVGGRGTDGETHNICRRKASGEGLGRHPMRSTLVAQQDGARSVPRRRFSPMSDDHSHRGVIIMLRCGNIDPHGGHGPGYGTIGALLRTGHQFDPRSPRARARSRDKRS